MQLSTSKDALLPPLSLVAGAADPRGTIPMLATVLLKATDGRLSMLCSDTGLVARSLAHCTIESDGEIAVDVKRLSDLVRAIPDTESLQVTLEEKGTLLVKAGRSRFRLPTHPAAEFPRLKAEEAERVAVVVSVKRLAEMFEQVTPAMAQADMRAYLNGTLLALQDGHLWVVATDGFRLAVAREPVAGTEGIAPKEVILPRKTVLLARKLLGQSGDVKVTLGATDAQFSFQDGSLVFGKAIDGKYPAFRSVIPSDGACATVNASRLAEGLSMLEAATVAAKDSGARVVEVGFTKQLLTLAHGDTARCELDAECTGDAQTVAFNIEFLKDAVGAIGRGQEKVRLFYQGPTKPLVVKPLAADYPLSVVMSYRN